MKTDIASFSLLGAQASPGWSRLQRLGYYGYRAFLVLAGGACMGLALLALASGQYGWTVLPSYFSNPLLLALNALPVVCVTALLYGLTGRCALAFGLGGLLGLGFSLGNYYMLLFRDDPLYMLDLLSIREAANMTTQQSYELTLTTQVAVALGCWALGILLLAVLARGRLGSWKARLVWVASSVLAMALLLPVYQNGELYESIENFKVLNPWSDTQKYVSRGFWYPFLHSSRDMVSQPPEGYDAQQVQALLEDYPDADIPQEQKVNLIVIMREAYVDLSRFDIPGLDTSGYADHQAWMDESYSGDLVVNIFAGGTIDTEQCVLTGSYAVRSYRSNANSYLWYLRSQGYTVEGSHPYYQWFYNRRNVNGYLGFERYRFWEEDYEYLMDGKLTNGAQMPPDDILFEQVYEDYRAGVASGKPYFAFVLNVESHGPYSDTQLHDGVQYLSGDYSQGCKNAVSNYIATSLRGDAAIRQLVERLRQEPEPVVVMEFSDHLPWMGDGNVYYQELGLDLDPETAEGYLRRYTTHYAMWANDAAKELLGHDMVGTGPTVSPNFLMNLLFDQLGWEGPGFMQAMDEILEVLPVTSVSARVMADGQLYAQVPEELADCYSRFRCLQYHWSYEPCMFQPAS